MIRVKNPLFLSLMVFSVLASAGNANALTHDEAATKIQTIGRGYIAREKLKSLKRKARAMEKFRSMQQAQGVRIPSLEERAREAAAQAEKCTAEQDSVIGQALKNIDISDIRCAICKHIGEDGSEGSFQMGDEIMKHRNCKGGFHPECLQSWHDTLTRSSNPTTCPHCAETAESEDFLTGRVGDPKLKGDAEEVDPHAAIGAFGEFAAVEAGTFKMGSAEFSNATPHEVYVSSFEMNTKPVTRYQWKAVTRKDAPFPSWLSERDKEYLRNCLNCPVNYVSHEDVVKFIKKANKLSEKAGSPYRLRLPTEAEWEKAARAGAESKYSFGDQESDLEQHAWFGKNTEGRVQEVGKKLPNALGLYDMHGNVWEWVSDW